MASIGGLLRGQHDVVQLALRRREAAARREGAGDVGRVAVEFAGGVDQDQVAVLGNRVAGRVVQHAGIRAGRDDRRVSRRLRAEFAERVEQLGFEFVLAHAGMARGHRAAMRLRGNLSGAAHDGEFVVVLEEPHLVEQRDQVARGSGRGDAAAALRAHRVEPAAHLFVQLRRGAERVMQRWLVGENARQLRVDFVDGERGVEAERLARAVRAETETFPRFALDILLAAEQDRSRFARRGACVQHQQRLGFGEAGQIVEVAVVPVGVVGVPVAQLFRRGGDDGDAPARRAQRGEDALTARAVDVDGDGGFGRLVHRAIVAPNAETYFARDTGGERWSPCHVGHLAG